MLHEECTSTKNLMRKDVFIKRVDVYVMRNINPSLKIREYQKEALGRLDFYTEQYSERKK